LLTYSVYFRKYQNYVLPTPTSCLALSCGCDGQIAFCCRTNSLLLLHELFVLPFSPYLSSRSRTNSHLLLRTTNCPLVSDFWIVRSERTFSVYLLIAHQLFQITIILYTQNDIKLNVNAKSLFSVEHLVLCLLLIA
jgi:hypothetical protein